MCGSSVVCQTRALTVTQSSRRVPVKPVTAVIFVVLAAALGLLAEHLGHSWEQPAWIPIADLAVGWAMVGSGVVAAVMRPAQPAGRRLVLAGFLWFVGTFQPTDIPHLGTLGFILQGYFGPVLVLIALSFPARWPARRSERVVISAVAVLYGVSSVIRLVAWWPDLFGADLFDPSVMGPLVGWSDLARLCAIVFSGGLIVRRWVQSTAAGRRIVGPVIAAGAASAFAVALALYYPLTALGIVPEPDGSIALAVAWTSNLLWLLIPFAMLFGIVRQGASRSALAEAVAAAGVSPGPIDLGGALAQALRDPSLRILSWDAARQAYVDDEGNSPNGEPVAGAGQSVAIVSVGERPLAALIYDAALDEDPGIIAGAVAVTRLVVENVQLVREVGRQLEDVRTSRARIVEAGDVERRRIERDLHDGVQQRLIALAMHLRRAESDDPGSGVPAEALAYGADEALGIVEDVREFASGIHPAVLFEAGLAAAIRGLADRSPVPVQLEMVLTGQNSPTTTATAFFVISEALTNVTKHALATNVWVRASDADGALNVAVEDDGRGGAVVGDGLRGLSDRVAALGGTFGVRARAGGGTTVTASVPLG
jgi:signal transduction histidine kinase